MGITLKKLKLDKKNGLEIIKPNMECKCGCGGEMAIKAEDEKEVLNVMCSILNEFDCDYCFGVAFRKDGQANIVNKINKVCGVTDQLNAMRSLHKIVDDLQVHHLVILEEIEDDYYKFIG